MTYHMKQALGYIATSIAIILAGSFLFAKLDASALDRCNAVGGTVVHIPGQPSACIQQPPLASNTNHPREVMP